MAWASSLEPEEGSQLLVKLGLLEAALDYALESGAFAQAFQLCQAPQAQHKMPECHLKYAMYLEDEGKSAVPCTLSLSTDAFSDNWHSQLAFGLQCSLPPRHGNF